MIRLCEVLLMLRENNDYGFTEITYEDFDDIITFLETE